jgi:hypothetical protein
MNADAGPPASDARLEPACLIEHTMMLFFAGLAGIAR